MSLLQEVQQVAAEFDFPAKQVNDGVKEFIKQMGGCRAITMSDRAKLLTPSFYRGGPPEGGSYDEPDPNLCNGSTEWYGKGEPVVLAWGFHAYLGLLGSVPGSRFRRYKLPRLLCSASRQYNGHFDPVKGRHTPRTNGCQNCKRAVFVPR